LQKYEDIHGYQNALFFSYKQSQPGFTFILPNKKGNTRRIENKNHSILAKERGAKSLS
jgi:hypothetical protein